jgi:hypothetical protein
MILFNRIGDFCASLWRFIAGPKASDQFTCGECERRDSCGLPPSDQCVSRAEQMAEGRRRPLKL